MADKGRGTGRAPRLSRIVSISPVPSRHDASTAASVSADGNTLFFVRQEDKDGSTDIFMLRKLPNGAWSTPQKLSEEINTPYNEDFPYLSVDGTIELE